MSGTKLILLPLVVAGLSLGIAACGDDDDDAGDEGGGEETSLELVVGDSVPLSGDLADFGPPGEKAANLALEEINAAIEDVGADHTVELIHEDNCGGADQQCAVQAARKLVDSDGASCIAGAWASADTIPTAESVTIPNDVVLVSPASTSDEITGLEDNGTVNRTAPPDSFQGPTLANYVDAELGGAEGKTVNIGARNDAYGTGLAGTFTAAWEELGGSVGEEVVYDIDLPNYDSEADDITAGNPDGIVIIDFPETFNKVGPALVRSGNYDPATTFVTDGLISSDLAEGAGEDAVNGLRGTAPGTPDEETQTVAFDEAYKAFEPADVGRQTFDAQNFDAVILCYLAAVAAGSTEGADMAAEIQAVSSAPGDPYTWEELPAAIEALQNGDDIDYQGAAGAIDMNEDGDATAGVYDIYEFRAGAPEPVDEVEVATPES
jgi:ABC-type branched-subunit amino acid transport system substrate-binding protein